jgi:hypothetical protein
VFASAEVAREIYLRWDRLRRFENPALSYIASGAHFKLQMRPFSEVGGPGISTQLYGEVARQGAAMGQVEEDRALALGTQESYILVPPRQIAAEMQRTAERALAGRQRARAPAPAPAASVEDEYMPATELAEDLNGLSLLTEEASMPQELLPPVAAAAMLAQQPAATSRRRLVFHTARDPQRAPVTAPSGNFLPQVEQHQPATQPSVQAFQPPVQQQQPYGAFFPYGGPPQQQPFSFPYPLGPSPYGGLLHWMPQMAYQAPHPSYQSNSWSSASYQPPPQSFPPSPYAYPPGFYSQGPPRQF